MQLIHLKNNILACMAILFHIWFLMDIHILLNKQLEDLYHQHIMNLQYMLDRLIDLLKD